MKILAQMLGDLTQLHRDLPSFFLLQLFLLLSKFSCQLRIIPLSRMLYVHPRCSSTSR